MTWPRPRRAELSPARAWSVLATSSVTSLTTGALFFVSGSLGTVLATQMAEGPGGNVSIVYGLSIAAMVMGIGLATWGRQFRPGHHHLLVATGTAMLTIAIFESTSAVAAVALANLYISVAIDACVLFSWQLAALHMALAATCCMTVLAVRVDTPWWAGMVASGATIGVGIVVGLLSRFAADGSLDALTGLPNRRGFDRVLTREIARATLNGSGPALVVMNLDRFHAINDEHGYRTGDEVLRRTVQAWQLLLRPGDTLARRAGDKFALLMPDTTDREATALTEQLRATISMGSSAGVTSWQRGDSASTLLSRADAGLYRAKLTGGHRTVLESPSPAPLVVELAAAITNDLVEVRYQPIVRLSESAAAVVGVEALIRWAAPSRPDVTPAEVVRIAEESGLIVELDRYVMRRACLDANVLQGAKNDGPLDLSVNVAGLELAASDYVDVVDGVLRDTGWAATQLVLEVTESVLDVDTPATIANLHALRSRGIRIAIDDFGTGYSSLSRIQAMPVDLLKLDRSFICTVTNNAPTPPLLRAIALLGIALDLPVVAEGVEDHYQAAAARSLGYAFAQGFYYGEPRSVTEVVVMLGGAPKSA